MKNRDIELAKRLLERKGYSVSKKMREAHTVELYKSHGEDPERKRFSDYESAKEFADSQTDDYEEIIITIPAVGGPSTVNSWSKKDGWFRTVESNEVNESENMRESTDDRQQRRIVKNIADEVIRSRGENNSIGRYDRFIRQMMDNWATSGQDREFIKSAIEKSFDEEFSKTNEGAVKAAYSDSHEDREEAPIRPGRKPNGDEKDEGIFTPGSEDERDHRASSENSESLKHYNVYYTETTERGDVFRYLSIKADSKEEARGIAQSKFKSWNNKDVFRIEDIVEGDPIDESKNSLKESIKKAFSKKNEAQRIVIHKPDDLVGKPNPKFKVTYSTSKGETTTLHVEATDEESAKAIIRGRCRRNGKTPKFISVEKVSESISEDLDYEEMKYMNPIAIGSRLAKHFADEEDAEDKIKSAIDEIMDDAPAAGKQRALDSAIRELEMEKDLASADPMSGHKYLVSGSTPNVTETGTDYNRYDGGFIDDPREAIESWLQLSKEAPTSVSIDTNKNAYADELLNWVVDNEEEFRSLCNEYGCPYKVDYIVDACKKGRSSYSDFERKSNKYHYPDQIYPFSVG